MFGAALFEDVRVVTEGVAAELRSRISGQMGK